MPVNVEQIQEYHEYLHRTGKRHNCDEFKAWEQWAIWMNEQHEKLNAVNRVLAAIQEEQVRMAENAYLN